MSSPPRGMSYNGVSRSQSSRAHPPSSTTANTRDLPSRAASQNQHSSPRHYPSASNGGGYDTDDYYHRRATPSRDASSQQPPNAAATDPSSRPRRHSSHRSVSRHGSSSTHSPQQQQPPASGPSADMAQAAAGAPATAHENGGSQHHGRSADPRAVAARPTKSRTTIPTPSGKWFLGKVIGAGSMGKVRLATKEDSSEQVRFIFPVLSSIFLLFSILRCAPCFPGRLQDHPTGLDRRQQPPAGRKGACRSVQRDQNRTRGCHCHPPQSPIYLRPA